LVGDQWPGQAELGGSGQKQPGPPVGLLRMADPGVTQPSVCLQNRSVLLDGLIASDKFCWTHRGQLRLDWWRRPLRLRPDRRV
jgi:hypothetical protein